MSSRSVQRVTHAQGAAGGGRPTAFNTARADKAESRRIALSPIRTVTVGPGISPGLLTLNVAEALAGFEA